MISHIYNPTHWTTNDKPLLCDAACDWLGNDMGVAYYFKYGTPAGCKACPKCVDLAPLALLSITEL